MARSTLFCQTKLPMQGGVRISPHPDVELLGFDDPGLRRRAPEFQLVFAEFEMDRSFFTSLERHPVKALELPNGSGSTARSLVNVELHYSIAGALAVVGYLGGDLDRVSNPRRRRHRQVGEREARVAQSITKGKQRSAEDVPVTRFEVG